jgi:hypothetical protein
MNEIISRRSLGGERRGNFLLQFVVLQKLRHFTRKAFRFPRWRKTRSHGASPINQELREVPFYSAARRLRYVDRLRRPRWRNSQH